MRRHYWRIEATHTREEYLQEARVTFLRCAAKYPALEAPQHFMSLFQRAWLNDLNDLSNKATKAGKLVSDHALNGETGEPFLHEPIGELENLGYLLTLVRQAPEEVLMVLNLFLNAPAELLELATTAWARQGHRSANGLVSRLLGLNPDQDVLGQVQRFFSNEG